MLETARRLVRRERAAPTTFGHAALLTVAGLLGACSDEGYRIELVTPDGFERSRVSSVDLAVVAPGGCSRADADGPDAADVERSFILEPTGTSALAGSLAPGRWGFFAVARDRECAVVLVGCSETELEGGGSGTIVVLLGAVDGPGCAQFERCGPAGRCIWSCEKDDDCDDGVDCTDDRCGDTGCGSTPEHLACDPGKLCDAQEGCVPSSACSSTADCSDDNLCNGTEICHEGVCQSGDSLGCDDGDTCTVGGCDAFEGCVLVARDNDHDGHTLDSCEGGDDCDDDDSLVFPGAEDLVGDAVDANCDGPDGIDADGDWSASIASGGDDCDDANPERHPGLPDNTPAGVWETELSLSAPACLGGACGGDALEERVSLAVGPDGTPQVVVSETNGGDVIRANRAGSTWSQDTVASYGTDGRAWTAIAVGPDGSAHVSYHGTNSSVLHVATDGSGSWVTMLASSIANDMTGRNTSIAVDGDGVRHVVFRQGAIAPYALGFASDVGGNWVTQSDLDTGGFAASIALDSDRAAHVSHCTAQDGDTDVHYLTNASGAWVSELVAGARNASQTSVALDAFGAVHIAYGYDNDVWHATNESGAWATELIGRGRLPSLVPTTDGKLHAVYIDPNGLQHAAFDDGGWLSDRIDNLVDDEAGTALAVGPDGILHVAYQRGAHEVWHATIEPGALDGVDQNCDGVDGVDADGDGFASRATGGSDCNDGDETFGPGAIDVADRLDQDCDGVL